MVIKSYLLCYLVWLTLLQHLWISWTESLSSIWTCLLLCLVTTSWSTHSSTPEVRRITSIISELSFRLSRITSYMPSSRSEFWLKSMAFLGHIISCEGIQVHSQKIETVKNCPHPHPNWDKEFLGFAWLLRMFVEGFSSISYPLTKLTQKKTKFQWSEACEKSFQQLVR